MKLMVTFCLIIFLTSTISVSGESNISLKGDFRYRHDWEKKESTAQRHRQRIRARITLGAKVNDNIQAKLRLATGSPGDPVSRNQSLDGAAAGKPFLVDLAFLSLTQGPAKLVAGKIKNPFFRPEKTELIWDGDLTPEGIALKIAFENLSVIPFVTGSFFWFEEEESSSSDDKVFAGGQLGVKAMFGSIKIIGGGSYFDYIQIKNNTTIAANDGNNPVDGTTGNYLNDYNLIEGFLTFKVKAGKIPFAVFGNFVTNIEADTDKIGWLGGASFGKVNGFGTGSLTATYRQVESDAVVGALTDSDFSGGGTDGRGLKVKAGVGVMKNTSVSLSYFFNEQGLNNGTSYNRILGDVKVKF